MSVRLHADWRAERSTSRIGRTPVLPIRLRVGGRWREVMLKLEQFNPGGSIKDRTAYALIEDLELRGRLRPGATVVESTSGNLGVALAYVCREYGYGFVAVVDPLVSEVNIETMRELGAVVERVQRSDVHGNYLAARRERVREIATGDPGCVWTDQYGNRANPRAHREQTGPEILRQAGPGLAAVLVAVSTGGTLAGIADYLRPAAPGCRIVAVDVRGSAALGGPRGPRRLVGIGASRRSAFVRPEHYDTAVHVSDAEAIAACRLLRRCTGIGIGGSSGAVLAAAARVLRADDRLERVVCVCPDGADRYESTVYNRLWLAKENIDPGDAPFEDAACA
ncbi:pyridoxal-phosphate dependent enzyme [Marinitenerispora sediminis]|uniref:Cysteine synthase n=1 Tax=Marinitenerispora sediminis TaxID=1931232 RepID=A0A368T961_9ACTN|nr:pyridoxal-phosphate dependent enzyme [Marinitenerispora sediminis]RCV49008.1 cysteine synthase [Marinitenerispora sediminis]RCV51732.1 cysteine synthase [Marinitenerispora sediminis]RCV60956.1 cysteine synthase [Marinitenerispora sediminis]